MIPCQLRIVIFPDTPRSWTARGLEHDLSARGPTIDSALDALLKIAAAHVAYDRRHNHVPLSAFAPAPRRSWLAFLRGERIAISITKDWSDTAVPTQILPTVLWQHPSIPQLVAESPKRLTAASV